MADLNNVFSQPELAYLQTRREAAANGVISYSDVYQDILNILSTTEIDPDTGEQKLVPKLASYAEHWVWMNGLIQVNSGVGPFSDFIRTYTSEQHLIRKGRTLTDEELSDVSNDIAITSCPRISEMYPVPS